MAKKNKGGKPAPAPEPELREQLEALEPAQLVGLAHESSMAWKHKLTIDPGTTTALLGMSTEELAPHIEKEMELKNCRTDLRAAVVRDYYMSAVWMANEKSLSLQEASAAVNVCHELLENCSARKMSLQENAADFASKMGAIGAAESQLSRREKLAALKGDVRDFGPGSCDVMTDFVSTGLFQHYRMYISMFHEGRPDDVQPCRLVVEVPHLLPSLDEGRSETERLQREATVALEALTLGGDVPDGMEPAEARELAQAEVLKALEQQAAAKGLEMTDAMKAAVAGLAEDVAGSLLVPPTAGDA